MTMDVKGFITKATQELESIKSVAEGCRMLVNTGEGEHQATPADRLEYAVQGMDEVLRTLETALESIPPMSANELQKNWKRMCGMYAPDEYGDMCDGCPLLDIEGVEQRGRGCAAILMEKSGEAYRVIGDWAKKHPAETYFDRFVSAHGMASEVEGIPDQLCLGAMLGKDCPKAVYYEGMGYSCEECWHTSVDEF